MPASAVPATLLVVDDEATNRDLLGRRLEQQGFQVRLAASGAEALGILAVQPCDLVLLDIMMPGMSGLDVLAAIRRTPAWHDLPVIMVTAKSDSHDVVEALDLGADDYVIKPLDFLVAPARVRRQLTRAAAERAAALHAAGPGCDTGPLGTAILAEDDHEVRAFLRGVLERDGYCVIDAPRGDLALEAAAHLGAPPALLVTDLDLPGLTGWELAAGLRRTHPELPVVFMTGHDGHGLVAAAGVGPLLQKPFTIAEFSATVGRVHPRNQASAVYADSQGAYANGR